MTLSVSSASIRSIEISLGASFPFWLISANVFVKSTRVPRPSEADKSRMERWGGDLEEVASREDLGEAGGENDCM